jgi:hypothetical protein
MRWDYAWKDKKIPGGKKGVSSSLLIAFFLRHKRDACAWYLSIFNTSYFMSSYACAMGAQRRDIIQSIERKKKKRTNEERRSKITIT